MIRPPGHSVGWALRCLRGGAGPTRRPRRGPRCFSALVSFIPFGLYGPSACVHVLPQGRCLGGIPSCLSLRCILVHDPAIRQFMPIHR